MLSFWTFYEPEIVVLLIGLLKNIPAKIINVTFVIPLTLYMLGNFSCFYVTGWNKQGEVIYLAAEKNP